MAFLLVLGEGVEVAFLQVCEAANRPFPARVKQYLGRGVGMGVRDGVAKTRSQPN